MMWDPLSTLPKWHGTLCPLCQNGMGPFVQIQKMSWNPLSAEPFIWLPYFSFNVVTFTFQTSVGILFFSLVSGIWCKFLGILTLTDNEGESDRVPIELHCWAGLK